MDNLNKIETMQAKYLDNGTIATQKDSELITIALLNNNKLVVDKERGKLILRNEANECQLVINIDKRGVSVNINASRLNISTTEEISLSSRKIKLAALEQIDIVTNGNLVQKAEKDMLMETGGASKSVAKIQKITATLGNVEIKANDDVRLDGESVKLNCDD